MSHFLRSLRFSLILLVFISVLPALGLILHNASEQRRMAVAGVQSDTMRLTRLAAAGYGEFIEAARQLLVAVSKFRRVQERDTSACNEILADLLKQYPFYHNLGVFDLHGEQLCSALPPKLNIADRPWFQHTLRNRTFTAGEYQASRISGTPVIIFACPVLDRTGGLSAVVATSLNLSRLNQFAAQIELPQGAVLTVIDRGGSILSRYPDPDKWVGKSLSKAPLIRDVLARHTGVSEVEGEDGVLRLYAFEPVHHGSQTDEIGMHVSIGIPKALVLAEADRSLRTSLMGLGLVAILALAIMWYGGEMFILRLVDRLLSATNRLSEGDLGARAGIPHDRGEIGRLASAFDKMAETLELRNAERNRAEEMLRKTQDRLHRALENIPDVVVIYDRDLRIQYINSATRRITGRPPCDFIGRKEEEIWPPEVYDVYLPTLKKAFETRATLHLEADLLVPEQGLRTLHITCVPIMDQKGDIREILGITHDTTKRKEMEEELRRSRDELEILVRERAGELVKAVEMLKEQAALLDLAHDAILVRDTNGKILYWNSGAEETYGWGKEEAMDKITHTLLRTQFPKPLEEIELDLLTDGQWEGELRHVTRAGRPMIIASRWAIQKDANGNPSAILEINRDITEKKRAEKEIESSMAMLERSNKDLQEFAYIASHDLQEPLRTISSFIQLIERRYKGKLDSDADEFITYVVDGARRMQSLINDLLQYSRVGTQGNPFEPTDLENIHDQVVSSLKTGIKETGALISRDPLPTLPTDPSRMAQLLQNLIGNGLKFRSEKTPQIHVSAKLCNREWLFSVKDNGIGINEEYSERIFQIFQRLHTKEKYPGTGIGLAICKRIVEQHGGKIWVESQEGVGSTFFFTIPTCPQPASLGSL